MNHVYILQYYLWLDFEISRASFTRLNVICCCCKCYILNMMMIIAKVKTHMVRLDSKLVKELVETSLQCVSKARLLVIFKGCGCEHRH